MTELMPSLCNDCIARNQCGTDDVKMCISYTKETKIKCDDCKFVEECVDYGWDECKKFTPKPSEPMTNEEWLRSATFEELVGAIYEWHSAGYTKGRLGLGLNPVTEVIEWLKQPHHEKE